MRRVKIAVIGGGITGQLFQFLVPEAEVFDWQPNPRRFRPLTRNFGANYLWEPLEGIKCYSFPVITRIDGQMPTLDLVKRYKDKIDKSGDVEGWERQFQPEMTGWDFAQPIQARVHYDYRVTEIVPDEHRIVFAKQSPIQYEILISTIPLYSLVSLMGIPEPTGRLKFKPIFFRILPAPPESVVPQGTMYVNYLSDRAVVPYRYCDRFGERHYESIVPFSTAEAKRFAPGKIYPHPGVSDLLVRLHKVDVYTFGRFGNWQPDELVHETWHAIRNWKKGKGL